jgi:hypothetical protein
VTVHRGRAFQQFLEAAPAQRERDREADRGPKRVAAADRFRKGQDRVSSTPQSIARSGLAVSATTRPNGSSTPPCSSQASAEFAFNMVSLVVKVLDAITTSVAVGSKPASASSSAAPSTLETTAVS